MISPSEKWKHFLKFLVNLTHQLGIFCEVHYEINRHRVEVTRQPLFKVFLGNTKNDEDGSFAKKISSCIQTSQFFSRNTESLVFVSCSDELNYIEYIFVKKSNGSWPSKPVMELTLTDNCP
jgi:hypothetical protein